MKSNESFNESIESGSCSCSDYGEDFDWFYDSRKLQTSFMRFFIKNEPFNKNDYFKSKTPLKELDSTDNSNRTYNIRETKIKQIYNDINNSKRKNVIKIEKKISYDNNQMKEIIVKSKPSLNKSNYSRKRNERKNNYTLDLISNNNAFEIRKMNKTYVSKFPVIKNYSNKTFNNFNKSAKLSILQDNLEENEYNYNIPSEKTFTPESITEKVIKSPDVTTKRTIEVFIKDRLMKTEKKPKIQKINIDKVKAFFSPRKNIFNSFTNLSYFSDHKRGEKYINNSFIKRKNFKRKDRAFKEKIVNETKNITLEPGQIIKPKLITKTKLKPVVNIVKNEDGSQSKITENTTLTTITVNEFIDPSKVYQDDFPTDIQIVRQHVTKIYRIETQNNPYPLNK
jgi:hypothetical protein